MQDDTTRPPITLSDPGRTGGDDVLVAGGDGPSFQLRQHPRLVALLVLLLVAGVVSLAVRNARRAESAEAQASALQLTAELGGGSSVQDGTHPEQKTYEVNLQLHDVRDREFRLLTVSLQGMPVELVEPPIAGPATRQLVRFRFTGGCDQLGGLTEKMTVHVTAQRPGHRLLSLRLPTDATEVVAFARHECGRVPVDEGFDVQALTPLTVRGATATADLELRDGSRDQATLLAVELPDAEVVVSPGLPATLLPFADGVAGRPVRLHLTIRYLRCPRPGRYGSGLFTFHVVDPQRTRFTPVVTFPDWADPLLALAGPLCHRAR